MRRITWVIGTATLSIMWLATSCGDDGGDELTIASSQSSSAVTNGNGGATSSSDGSGGATTSGTGGDPGMGGMGGFGGSPPEPVNGCLQATAMDLTGVNPANIDIPGNGYCIRILQNMTELTFTLANPPAHRYLGGVYDEEIQAKFPDAMSPILPSSNQSPYINSPAVTNPPYTFISKGEYPWYDDKNPATIRGVVYVE